MGALTDKLGGMDAAKAAGAITIGAVLVLAFARRAFHGAHIRIGD